MKNIIILTLITAMIITFSSCKAEDKAKGNASEVQKPVQTEQAPQSKAEEKAISGALKPAYEGKIDKIQIGVGDSLQQVIEEFGQPAELAHFEGSSYISYENISFMLDRVVESTNAEAEVLGIIVSEGFELYGVKVGMSPEEIKRALGAAEQEYQDGEDEGNMWKLEYDCGDYMLTFFFNDKASPSTSAYLSKLAIAE